MVRTFTVWPYNLPYLISHGGNLLILLTWEDYPSMWHHWEETCVGPSVVIEIE